MKQLGPDTDDNTTVAAIDISSMSAEADRLYAQYLNSQASSGGSSATTGHHHPGYRFSLDAGKSTRVNQVRLGRGISSRMLLVVWRGWAAHPCLVVPIHLSRCLSALLCSTRLSFTLATSPRPPRPACSGRIDRSTPPPQKWQNTTRTCGDRVSGRVPRLSATTTTCRKARTTPLPRQALPSASVAGSRSNSPFFFFLRFCCYYHCFQTLFFFPCKDTSNNTFDTSTRLCPRHLLPVGTDSCAECGPVAVEHERAIAKHPRQAEFEPRAARLWRC